MPQRDKLLSEFGRNVSRFRDQAGLSQDKLAEKAEKYNLLNIIIYNGSGLSRFKKTKA